jgi:hypothetical protein
MGRAEQAAIYLLQNTCLADKRDWMAGPVWTEELGRQAASWSSGERILYSVACDLYHGHFHGNKGTDLRDIVTVLDEGNFHMVIKSLLAARGYVVTGED